MAIWQNTFYICPKSILLFKQNSNIDDYEELWDKIIVDYKIFEFFSENLKRAKSWSEDIIIYGNTDSTCLEIGIKNDRVDFIRLRIDYRTEFQVLIAQLKQFLNKHDFVLLDANSKIVDPTKENIINIIKSSKQFLKYQEMCC